MTPNTSSTTDPIAEAIRTPARRRNRTMRTDRELLELAAKAAGVDPTPRHVWLHKPPFGFTAVYPACLVHDGKAWIPLTDDGDALRLAVKLKIDVRQEFGWVCATAVSLDGESHQTYFEDRGKDEFAATRRAIVLAASWIGAKMQGE